MIGKRIGFCALHYGRAYLASSIRSIIDSVDEYHVIYSDIGSHGSHAPIPCPEKRNDLYEIARSAAGDKLKWTDGRFPHEGAQRDMIYRVAPDADVVIVADSDEIYPNGLVDEIVEQTRHWNRRNIRVPFVHFWRSFNRCVIDDPAYPVRVIYPHIKANSEATVNTKSVAHMGYSQPVDITRYKILTHGHRGEWRQDWFDTKFLPNTQTDVHPTNHNYWNPVDVNPLDYLPDWMQKHPYYHLDVIE